MQSELDNYADPDLVQLNRWLNYQASTVFLFTLALIGLPSFVMALAKILAVAFSPFMVWKLVKLRRWGWLIGFGVFVMSPFAFASGAGTMAASFLLRYLPLIMFFVFCIALKLASNGWIETERDESQMQKLDLEREERKAEAMSQLR